MINDLQQAIFWWVIIFLIGVVSFPFTWLILHRTFDLGYGVAKTLGFVSVTYLIFLLSVAKILPLTRLSFISVLVVFGLMNLVILVKNFKEIGNAASRKIKIILLEEVLFLLGLISWSYVRAFQPDIRGLEKFMDFGFINSVLRSRFLPPVDMWAAGKTINYYWFGHLITAVLTKLSGIPSGVTYNLMLGTILGLTLTSAFSISTSILAGTFAGEKGKVIIIGGVLTALLLSLGGNFHTPFYALKNGYQKYWYPDATRFIGYNPETNDKTIHEFPSYSFIVSDLHGHLLDLPVVLLFLALLTSYVLKTNNERGLPNLKPESLNSKLFEKLEFGILKLIGNWKLEIGNSRELFALGLVLGVMFMTNTWDFGIYLLIAGVTIAIYNFLKRKFSWDFIYETFKALLTILVVGLICAIPFILSFSSIAQGVGFVKARTPIWQLSILWGFPALLSGAFFVNFLREKEKKTPQIFVISLLVAAWILIFLPEVIFVKDIYIATHHRANTMFKLTYQGFVVFYLVSGYIITSTLLSIKSLPLKLVGTLVASVVLASILIYPYFGVKSYYAELKNYRGLNGEAWLEKEYPGEYQAVLWFRKNVSGQPTILEAAGDSYTDFNVISSYSGLPTVSGWFVHEWLWRGSPEIPQVRANDVSLIYLSKNTAEAKSLLSKYQVSYVIVGTFERQKYPALDEDKFVGIGELVFSENGTKIYRLNYNPRS